jgi:hypothetical protein
VLRIAGGLDTRLTKIPLMREGDPRYALVHVPAVDATAEQGRLQGPGRRERLQAHVAEPCVANSTAYTSAPSPALRTPSTSAPRSSGPSATGVTPPPSTPRPGSTRSHQRWCPDQRGLHPLDTRRLPSQRRVFARQQPDSLPRSLQQLRNPGVWASPYPGTNEGGGHQGTLRTAVRDDRYAAHWRWTRRSPTGT